MNHHDFVWAIETIARGGRVRRAWWPRSKCLARNAHGAAIIMVGALHTDFVATRGDVNATDWREA